MLPASFEFDTSAHGVAQQRYRAFQQDPSDGIPSPSGPRCNNLISDLDCTDSNWKDIDPNNRTSFQSQCQLSQDSLELTFLAARYEPRFARRAISLLQNEYTHSGSPYR